MHVSLICGFNARAARNIKFSAWISLSLSLSLGVFVSLWRVNCNAKRWKASLSFPWFLIRIRDSLSLREIIGVRSFCGDKTSKRKVCVKSVAKVQATIPQSCHLDKILISYSCREEEDLIRSWIKLKKTFNLNWLLRGIKKRKERDPRSFF